MNCETDEHRARRRPPASRFIFPRSSSNTRRSRILRGHVRARRPGRRLPRRRSGRAARRRSRRRRAPSDEDAGPAHALDDGPHRRIDPRGVTRRVEQRAAPRVRRRG
ncbi:MAG: hypothetical protein MZV64_73500 [Ignavibacteriales bacterium]|nr:hypothetical protein [Ignavibacteriales bacterium]